MIRRTWGTLVVLGLAVAGLAGCRTSPAVAAYVGDAQVSTADLQSAVDERLADPDVAAYADGLDDGDFTRQVLSLMIGERVYDAVEARYDVEVTDAEVGDRLAELFAGEDEDTQFTRLAQRQGLVPADVREIVRELLLREEVAQAEGLADLSDAGLQDAYADAREAGEQFELGYLTVPDQATADAVAARLRADPTAYPALATQYAGTYTLAAPQLRTLDQVPTVLADAVQGVLPEGVFSLPVAETGGVLVGQVTFPPIEDLTDDLTDQVRQEASDAARPLVEDLESGLDITVNPRFGSLDDGAVVPADGGVVSVLGDAADAAPSTAAD